MFQMTGTQQARPPGETLWYSPARDITVLCPMLIRSALEDLANPELAGGATDAELCAVAEALAAYCSIETLVEAKTFEEAFTKSGLEELHREALRPVLYQIAITMLVAFWSSSRDSMVGMNTPEGPKFQITQYDVEAFKAEIDKAKAMLRVPRWRRGVYRMWLKIKERIMQWLSR